MRKIDRVQSVIDSFASNAKGLNGRHKIEKIMLFEGFSESGFPKKKTIALLGNWEPVRDFEGNVFDDTIMRLKEELERLNVAVLNKYSDEFENPLWSQCDGCGKIFRVIDKDDTEEYLAQMCKCCSSK
jgi:hypothetical protein